MIKTKILLSSILFFVLVLITSDRLYAKIEHNLEAKEKGWFSLEDEIYIIYEIENNTSKYYFILGNLWDVPEGIDIESGSIPGQWIGTGMNGNVSIIENKTELVSLAHKTELFAINKASWFVVPPKVNSGLFLYISISAEYFKKIIGDVSKVYTDKIMVFRNCEVNLYSLRSDSEKMIISQRVRIPNTFISLDEKNKFAVWIESDS